MLPTFLRFTVVIGFVAIGVGGVSGADDEPIFLPVPQTESPPYSPPPSPPPSPWIESPWIDSVPAEKPPEPIEERTRPGGSGGPGGASRPGYSVQWFPSQPVEGQPADLSVIRQRLAVGAPLWTRDGHKVILFASVRNDLFDTNAILPQSGRPFPEQLWNVNLGVVYSHEFANGWTGTSVVSVGSASDQPFHGIEEMTVNFIGSLRIPTRNQRDAWLFSLLYSPVGNFTFPIPGVAYAWNPNEQLSMTIGIPFFINWKPTEELSFELSYFPITNINARANYRLTDRLYAFAGFEWNYEAFFLVDRAERLDRFMGFEKRVLTGLRYDIFTKGAIDLQVGYAFDRVYGVGQNRLGNLQDQVDVDPGMFVAASFTLRF